MISSCLHLMQNTGNTRGDYMDPFTIGLVISAIGGVVDIVGKHKQGEYEREQARIQADRNAQQIGWQETEADWNKQNIGWQKEDLEKDKRASVGTLLTNTAAMGVGGPLVSSAKGNMLGEYNRALSQMDEQIGRIDTQKGWMGQQKSWGSEDLTSFTDQSKWNQGFGITSTLLTAGANVGFAAYQNSLYQKPAKAVKSIDSSTYRTQMFDNYKKYGSLGI